MLFKRLVKIDIPLWWWLVGIFFGQAQHLVEFLVQDVSPVFVFVHRFSEGVLATVRLALEARNSGFHIGHCGRFYVLLVADDGGSLRVDVEFPLAARTDHSDERHGKHKCSTLAS